MPTLPLNIQMGALPPTVQWTPQMLADAIAARLSITTQQAFALFVTGSTEPSSDVGPWLKNGTEWWVWSNTDGAYVPITINQESLGYFIGSAAPDQNIYQFWIETTVGGSPVSLKTYYSGAWVDVYASQFANYPTTAQMNAAIAGIPSTTIVAGQGSFSAKPLAVQNVVFAGPGTMSGTVALGSEVFDPDNCFASNEFTAPADGFYSFMGSIQISTTGGSPTDLDITGGIKESGIIYPIGPLNDEAGPDAIAGRTLTGSGYAYLTSGAMVSLVYTFTSDAAVTVEIQPQATGLSGYRVR